ncbi:MAG: hypothetical protein ACREFR_05435, partial [Limisphaerales bacterium]
ASVVESKSAARAVHPTTLVSPIAASSNNSGNPYESIVTRNVFGLNPIPPYTPPPPPQGPPPPKITLTGIMTIFGPPEALFKVASVIRGNRRPQDESYMFTEGEAQDDVQVTKIDVPKQSVTFMNHGIEQVIPLTEQGVTSSGSAPSAPSWPGQHGGRPPFGRRFRGFGGDNPGFQPQTFGGHPQSDNNSYNNESSSGNSFGNNSSGNSGIYNPSAAAVNAGLSGEDEAALLAAQHAQMQQQGNPEAAIFPPTPFDKQAGVTPGSDVAPQQGNPPPRR